jgi:ADP-ribose pyrophosphatase
LVVGQAFLDEEEFLDIFRATQDEISNLINSGLITDVKTIISYYWLKDYLIKKSPKRGMIVNI